MEDYTTLYAAVSCFIQRHNFINKVEEWILLWILNKLQKFIAQLSWQHIQKHLLLRGIQPFKDDLNNPTAKF